MRPGTGLFTSAAIMTILGIAAFFYGFAEFLFLSTAVALAVFAGIDFIIFTGFMHPPRANRNIPDILALGEKSEVIIRLILEDRPLLPPRLRVFDRWPDSFRCEDFPRLVRRRDWAAEREIELVYTVTPLERGPWEYRDLDLLESSPLGFWRKLTRVSLPSRGRTYPDFKALVRQASAELRGKTCDTGIKELRRRGQGLEFHSLRDYTSGDQIRSIDWRATARRGKPVVREYRDEEDQRILLLLDSGYRLHPKEGELRLFDRALNAAMFLSRVALKHGDAVAVQCFGNGERKTPFRKGLGALNIILNALHDQKSAPVPSSPAHALEEAARSLNRRTFIILVSRLREEDAASILPILPRLSRRHLLLCVNIADRHQGLLEASTASDDETLLAQAAAFRDRTERQAMYHRFERAGLMVLEVPSASLAPAMTAHYLALKGANIL